MYNYTSNKPLFSQHYLQYIIQYDPEWQININTDFQKLKNLYSSKQDILPNLNEAQTEEVFIKTVLEILGFSYINQVKTRSKGRAERPDYALFNNEKERDLAYNLQNNETAFYHRVIAITEAKYWERPLSKVSHNDKKDIYKNENPSFQIASYLTGTGVDWGILTNGREWRLYYRLASSTATEFYQIDLVEIFQTEDLEQFKYFWLFFRQQAFIKDSQGKNFLERVREGSTTYATRVGNELKALVFDSIFPDLAGGFVNDANRRGETVTSAQVYEATLSFLYKLLFLLYAEARNLLPIDSDYRQHSLIKLTQEVAQIIEKQKKLSQTSTVMYDKLLSLFQIVDRGDAGLEVPRYNGGLFHFDFQQKAQQIEYTANYFLSQFKICDAILAPVLDKLARFEGNPIDYSFLGVRQLGSIYEGLLEYRVKIEASNKVYLENDKGERKATGSYYTPEYIVKYIVSHTIKPILEQRQARFSELMAQISDLHNQMQDKRLGVQSINGLQKQLQRLEREAQSTLLDIKICDPAMGSGHFLVEAVDYLTDELISILNEYPEHNPVLEMLEKTRESILENLKKQGIAINPDKLEPTQLLQRVVMKRCIYGVDLNPMAVELAKVSLWLHSFTIGAPLSFLDHHLRCGNSLIGTTAKEAEAKMMQEESGQLNLLTGPFVGLLKAAEIMRGVSVLSDATFAEVEESERLFRAFDEAAKPYKRLLDVYVSQFFGVKQAKNYLQRLGVDAITVNPEKMKDIDRAVDEEARKLAEEKRFFHWDLEFPEVFIDLDNASWNEKAGFDVVIGNPPYGIIFDIKDKSYLEQKLPSFIRNNDLYAAFSQQSLEIITENGFSALIIPNTFILGSYFTGLKQMLLNTSEVIFIDNFNEEKLFLDANVFVCIFLVKKNKNGNKSLSLLRNCCIENSKIQYLNIWQVNLNHLPIERWFPFDKITEKARGNSGNLAEICLVKDVGFNYWSIGRGKTRGGAIADRVFYEGEKQHHQDISFIKGSDFNKYENISNPNHWLKYNYQEFLTPQVDIFRFSPEFLQINKKIVYRQTSDRIIASIDTESNLVDKTVHVIILKNEYSNYSYCYLLSLLNSSLMDFIYKDLAKEQGKLFAQVKTFRIKELPICKINFTTPVDRRQQSLENTITLYHQYQTNNDFNPILNQVNHHLNQQPEEADVIHDLLAYLAEQMLEMNKQKQTEIKSFLQWLERFIGCPIDTLTNKSKIQNYLGDYYKEEPNLSFDELIEVLKKNKKKLKIDPVARKEQQTLEKEYQASLETLLPIKTQLTRCDKLIDRIVYQLYGLTDEEIAIVEGK